MINIYFFGTAKFAEVILENLLNTQYAANIRVVFTKLHSPVAEYANQKKMLTYYQTNKHQLLEQAKTIIEQSPSVQSLTVFIVAAYGVIFTKELLDLPSLGCFNIHGSLLPKYRGASPIQAALLNGDNKTGVTIISMDEGVDTGKIVAQKEITIEKEDTYVSLSEKLADVASDLLVKKLLSKMPKIPKLKDQTGTPSYSGIITKQSGYMSAKEFMDNPQKIINKLKAFTPWPGVFTTISDLRQVYLNIGNENMNWSATNRRVIILKASLNSSKELVLETVQIEGKKPITWKQFKNGYLN